MTSRILMISTSREWAPQPTVPIGAAWVAEALRVAGFEVSLLDLCFQSDPFRALSRALSTFRPDGIGLSVRNLDNCDFLSPRSFLPELREITDFIKSRCDARILLGGAGVSIMPVALLQYLDLDHAVVGEGERSAVGFFSRGSLADAEGTPGVVSRRNSQPPAASGPHFHVMPQMHHWLNTKEYLRLEPVLPVQGKRGCANRCLYCTYNKIEGDSWRLRDPSSVVEEIVTSMRNTAAREFEFVDSIFNEPEGYLEGMLEELMRRGVKAKFRASSISPKGLTKAQLTLMERAGFSSLVITPESASDVTLAALRKGFTEEDIARAAELFSASKIRALWCFLLGAPKEDGRSLRKTIDFINRGISRKDAAFITTGIRIFPGTALHEVAVNESVIDASDDLLMPTFYFSPLISVQFAREELRKGLLDLSRCIFVSDTGSSSLGTLRRLGTMLKVPGPFWRYAHYVNKIIASGRAISGNSSPSRAVKR